MNVSGPGARDDLIDLDFVVYANVKVVYILNPSGVNFCFLKLWGKEVQAHF